jgi:hypothetical protein
MAFPDVEGDAEDHDEHGKALESADAFAEQHRAETHRDSDSELDFRPLRRRMPRSKSTKWTHCSRELLHVLLETPFSVVRSRSLAARASGTTRAA